MTKLILIRHGEPELPAEKSYIGVTDLPMSERGEEQIRTTAQRLTENLEAVPLIYASPLARSMDSAQIIARAFDTDVWCLEGLREIDLGIWENRSFREIREEFPEEFDARGRNLDHYMIPNGESFFQAANRFEKTVGSMLAQAHETEEEQTILAVTHGGVIRAFLGRIQGKSMQEMKKVPMPYASMTEVEFHNGEWIIGRTGYLPEEALTMDEIDRLYSKYQVPEHVRRHMAEVKEVLDDLLRILPQDSGLNRQRLEKAALLHDLCRLEKNHPTVSAQALRDEGYDRIAELVEEHNSTREYPDSGLTESELLYYADKLVREDQKVTLDDRFDRSREARMPEEGRINFEKRLRKAESIENKIKSSANRSLYQLVKTDNIPSVQPVVYRLLLDMSLRRKFAADFAYHGD